MLGLDMCSGGKLKCCVFGCGLGFLQGKFKLGWGGFWCELCDWYCELR